MCLSAVRFGLVQSLLCQTLVRFRQTWDQVKTHIIMYSHYSVFTIPVTPVLAFPLFDFILLILQFYKLLTPSQLFADDATLSWCLLCVHMLIAKNRPHSSNFKKIWTLRTFVASRVDSFIDRKNTRKSKRMFMYEAQCF